MKFIRWPAERSESQIKNRTQVLRFIDLAEELENAIGFKVDLVSKNGIKPKYLKAIKDELKYV